jgi:hypothetical protein
MSSPTTVSINCPHCLCAIASVAASSRTILTVTCANCAYTWATELSTMSVSERVAVQILMLERDHAEYAGHR